jgi:hypothetical protein
MAIQNWTLSTQLRRDFTRWPIDRHYRLAT